MEWNEDFAAKNLAGEGVCPWCGSDDFDGESFDIEDSTTVVQHVRCLKCDGAWVESYKRDGIQPLD